ncbi:superoxide dismutase family protein [Sorangium sp. So ce117]|uniref:superoxide dismutase family protein n=1 Tax=Sorangium sp. So ce117 TaxID=3133277 RepID=UPI003F60433C
MSRWLKLSLFALGASALLAACGDDGESSAGSGSGASTSAASGSGGGDASTSTSASGSGGGDGDGGSGGGDGGSGGGESLRAEAELQGLNSSGLTGTATFTQAGEEVTLTITVSGCPAGEHSAHIHQNKSCENNGDAAGAHWIPNGEGLGSFMCDEAGQGTQLVKRGTDIWTVGGDEATDVTKYAIVVHAAADPQAGGRIACGLIELE